VIDIFGLLLTTFLAFLSLTNILQFSWIIIFHPIMPLCLHVRYRQIVFFFLTATHALPILVACIPWALLIDSQLNLLKVLRTFKTTSMDKRSVVVRWPTFFPPPYSPDCLESPVFAYAYWEYFAPINNRSFPGLPHIRVPVSDRRRALLVYQRIGICCLLASFGLGLLLAMIKLSLNLQGFYWIVIFGNVGFLFMGSFMAYALYKCTEHRTWCRPASRGRTLFFIGRCILVTIAIVTFMLLALRLDGLAFELPTFIPLIGIAATFVPVALITGKATPWHLESRFMKGLLIHIGFVGPIELGVRPQTALSSTSLNLFYSVVYCLILP